jgi:hypothetical protein
VESVKPTPPDNIHQTGTKVSVIRDVHYSEDGVEDISLKRKKQVAPTGDNTRGYVEKETKKNRSEIKGQKMYAEKMARICHSTKKRWVQGGHRGR